ncbi:DUF3130 family protein [Listeria booriae]|uniref:DUF3130 family protein n=1 Tax=Listeria booriae TaxID=1552123 RepID=A0A099W6D8_9LIST|nr:DUF3130 family protein [Listeria booriae]KGL40532.1 hypothetical protein EP57_08220 [Listeria booriae]MBC1905456.1 DUF3130 family protein [Listeria booriae]MBC1914003.1 DUF3130 family protein [Listeria booriae]MBC2242483.1 DUF3130 family protein [Listeria booriae]STY41949.1 Protein of uncharacterised function (DUF3130 [Listeria booriae]
MGELKVRFDVMQKYSNDLKKEAGKINNELINKADISNSDGSIKKIKDTMLNFNAMLDQMKILVNIDSERIALLGEAFQEQDAGLATSMEQEGE